MFCAIDECWVRFEPAWRHEVLAAGSRGKRRRLRRGEMHPSEIMTIRVWFHHARYRTGKADSTEPVHAPRRGEFPTLVSDQRFVALRPSGLLPLTAYLHTQLGTGTGIGFVDSPPLAVCRPARITRHRVCRADAARGQTSVGWCYGCKLHLVVNDRGALLAFCLTRGNVDDRPPVPALLGRVRGLFGRLFGDQGSLSPPLAERLLVEHGVRLITRLRSHRRTRLRPLGDTLLVRKRAIIETINDQLKNVSQIEHTRHRSPRTFLVNLLGGLIASCHQPKKPSLHLDPDLEIPALAPPSRIRN